MLSSLFGDLGPARDPDGKKSSAPVPDGAEQGFVATKIMESVETEVNALGMMVDRHSHDLVVTGSPAQAIREHFSTTRSDLDIATSLITLLDPTGVWAAAVIKALSDASGRPIERLHLRDHSTLRTLATIERTTLTRRHGDTLRIYHADVRAPGIDNAEVPIALMERSQMTAVIIGGLQSHAIDALLKSLNAAAMLPTWRCPNLLFMLPPNAVSMASKVSAVPWPSRLHVHVTTEAMSGASSVWNAMLGMWNQIKTHADRQVSLNQPQPASPGTAADASDVTSGIQRLGSTVVGWADTEPVVVPRPVPVRTSTSTIISTSGGVIGAQDAVGLGVSTGPSAPTRADRTPLDSASTTLALRSMLSLEGLLGCAVVDAITGLILAREVREVHQGPDEYPVDMDLAGAACAQVLRAHRDAARSMGLSDKIEEVMTSAGTRHHVLRVVERHPTLFLMALLEKKRTNLALARFHLLEVEREMR